MRKKNEISLFAWHSFHALCAYRTLFSIRFVVPSFRCYLWVYGHAMLWVTGLSYANECQPRNYICALWTHCATIQHAFHAHTHILKISDIENGPQSISRSGDSIHQRATLHIAHSSCQAKKKTVSIVHFDFSLSFLLNNCVSFFVPLRVLF